MAKIKKEHLSSLERARRHWELFNSKLTCEECIANISAMKLYYETAILEKDNYIYDLKEDLNNAR